MLHPKMHIYFCNKIINFCDQESRSPFSLVCTCLSVHGLLTDGPCSHHPLTAMPSIKKIVLIYTYRK